MYRRAMGLSHYRLRENENVDGVRSIENTRNNNWASKLMIDQDEQLHSSNHDYISDSDTLFTDRKLSEMSKLHKSNQLSSSADLSKEYPRGVLWPRMCYFARTEKQGFQTKRCFSYEHEQNN
ncbi:unnamed protein product [Didymodactylos carnosus]|uniref:Uncharacterized protein n=1 Tax=Didymodactylos carnosus TaxID=1234261 RepID=A0A814GRI6_9BILA|nr:unnamed protein product [Didymodactylos carnosus]CAF1129724.1 unnamed protein product [Didymodactylos carnosus]CAF3771306.1 unnamed protein product [Didymodactylos carnosus]CAF3911634.1 unnamed protein product [Didymodactylos carnosus]